MLSPAIHRLIAWVFPPLCVHCGREGSWLCETAEHLLANERPFRVPPEYPALDDIIVRGQYDNPVIGKIIRQTKYAYWHALSEVFPDIMQPIARVLECPLATVVAPIPLHPRRLRQRGFNQADLLGRAVATVIQRPLRPLLIRTRYTTPQAHLHETERQQNLLGAFALHSAFAEIPDCVILVDDVITTGATIGECASVLKRHGVQRIVACTLAKG